MRKKSDKNDIFSDKRFDVEHALSIYAHSFVNLPATGLYDADALQPYEELLRTCHIYFIGFLPKLSISDSSQQERLVTISLEALDQNYELTWEFPEGAKLRSVSDRWFVETPDGQKYAPTDDHILTEFSHKYGPLNFKVVYIGQAYGRDGKRTALTRLLQHETLQKIAIRGAPEGYSIALLMVAVQLNNQLLTVFNPRAKEKDKTGERIHSGLEKLFGTSEQERIALYEAAMIRYFKPEYNIEFKESFPSTRLKILQDSYEKDFSAVVAEFAFDDIPVSLYSDCVQPNSWHSANHDLHKDKDRKAFFGL